MSTSPGEITTLERELRGIFGSRLKSLVVYGEHMRTALQRHDPDAGRGSHGHADVPVQTMAIVETLTGEDLRGCAGRVGTWHDLGFATPLVLAAHEFERSLDVFPLEFGAILADHTLIAGSNPFDGLTVDQGDLRRAVEVQARSHLLHLREGYLETRGRSDALSVLILQSAAAFAALLTSVARLAGQPTSDAAAAARHAERLLATPDGSMTDIVRLAGVHEISSKEAERVFPTYFDAVQKLVAYVDGWGAQ
jgi:hypothetical protein